MDTSVFSFSSSDNILRKIDGVSLDREAKEFYDIVFQVCDDNGNCCNQTVHVRVVDMNDNSQSDGGLSVVEVFYLQGCHSTNHRSIKQKHTEV